ncbi:MAG: peptide ABC transporter substrate-binding protein [Chlamydiota bacterium]
MTAKYLFWIIIFPVFLSSCCNEKRSVGREKKDSQIIRINYIYSPFSIDPRKGTDPITTVMNHMLYEGLTRLETDGTVSPALAERIKISKDRKTYLFFLRKSLWSDGSSLTAYHFEAAWKKALHPDFPSKAVHLLFPIENAAEAKTGLCSVDDIGVEAVDGQTLLVRLKRPTPYFLQLTAYPIYFPVPHNGDEVPHPNQQADPLTNGPFHLSSWRDSDEIIAIKNPYYWNTEEVRLDEIHATIISDEATALKLFDQGKIDYLGGLLSPLPLDALATLKKAKHLRQRAIDGTTFTALNVDRFPFNNVHIRKAFAFAIDKKEIVDNISQMFDDIASGPVPQVLKGVATTIDREDNRVAALRHFELGLQELGIRREEFPPVTYCYFNTELQRNLALALQSQWKDVLGVEIKLETGDLKSHLATLRSQLFQMGQMSWIGQYHDRMCFLERFASKDVNSNYSRWENRRYQQLLEDSFYKETVERVELLDEAEQMLIEDMPIIPIYHYHAVYIKNPRLKGLVISPLGDVQFHKAFLD